MKEILNSPTSVEDPAIHFPQDGVAAENQQSRA